jgi:hypothetical protein
MLGAWLRKLDTESVATFQTMYYIVFALLGVTLLIPGVPVQHAHKIMHSLIYTMWIGLQMVCPVITLVGRRVSTKAAAAPAGAPNLSVLGAWLQFGGDWGVWVGVQLWTVSMFFTPWWTHNLFVLYFMFMGVGGGAMFTLRSLRRLLAIRARK